MNNKYYGIIGTIVMGIVLVVLSIILFIYKGQFYMASINFIILLFFLAFIVDLYDMCFRKNKDDKIIRRCIFHIGTCFFFYLVPNLFYGIAPVMFSIYLCLIGSSEFIMCYVMIRNGEFIRIHNVLIGFVCFFVALPIFINPVMRLDRFVICIGIYLFLLGVYYIYDFIRYILPIRYKNKIKRRIRITLPKILEAIIPYSVMQEINRNLEVKDISSYKVINNEGKKDLSILIHTSNRGVNRMGHMDIYFDGKVISYGNYDEGSRFGKEFFGDGVLFIVNDFSNYINFCIDNSKKTIFEFGISLTDIEKELVRKKINALMNNTVSWDYREDKKYNNGDSYLGKLFRSNVGSTYKFKRGKYKTYFVMGRNCSHLIDEIVGSSGMDILSINGIITPGTYYDYLYKELRGKNSNVISMSIYNERYKAYKDMKKK